MNICRGNRQVAIGRQVDASYVHTAHCRACRIVNGEYLRAGSCQAAEVRDRPRTCNNGWAGAAGHVLVGVGLDTAVVT